MFKLLIVDDEPTIRRGLTTLIPWEQINVSLVGEAVDGVSALEMARELRPDIVITDIRMPRLDGLELTKSLTEELPDVAVIILTGYADFSYAQTALRYGVADFVLKPTSKDKIISAVKRAQERLLEGHMLALGEELPALRTQFLEHLTRRLVSEPELAGRVTLFNLHIGRYYLGAFRFAEYAVGRRQRSLSALSNIVNSANKEGYTYFLGDNTVLSIFAAPDGETDPSPPKSVLVRCNDICETVTRFSEACLSVGLSLSHDGVSELPAAGEEAIHALSQQFFSDENISVYARTRQEPQLMSMSETSFLCDIEILLENYDFEPIDSRITAFFALQRDYVVNAQDTINTCIQLCYSCARVLVRNGRQPLVPEPQEQISRSTSLSALEKLVMSMLEDTQKALRQGAGKNSPAVVDALAYIDKNYSSRLCLNDIASEVHLSSHHLCRIFKTERGETINEYITRRRIDEAKRLLREGKSMSYEVAEKVGFNDPAYFSLIFKKLTGSSPKNYVKP